MAKHYPKETRTIAGELALSGLDAAEITRRLNAGEAKLDYPIGISERRVREYVRDYEREHGPPPDPALEDPTADSIARLKHRAVAVLAREVRHLEELPAGRVSPKASAKLRQHYATLDDMERRLELAEARRAGKARKRRGSEAPSGKAEPEETELQRKAREYREGKISGPPSTTTQPTQGIEAAAGGSQGEDEGESAVESGVMGGEPLAKPAVVRPAPLAPISTPQPEPPPAADSVAPGQHSAPEAA